MYLLAERASASALVTSQQILGYAVDRSSGPGAREPREVDLCRVLAAFALTHDPERVESTIAALLYPASKSAVTMLTMQYAKALPAVRFNAADPGYTATDLNGHSGTQTVTGSCSSRMVTLILPSACLATVQAARIIRC